VRGGEVKLIVRQLWLDLVCALVVAHCGLVLAFAERGVAEFLFALGFDVPLLYEVDEPNVRVLAAARIALILAIARPIKLDLPHILLLLRLPPKDAAAASVPLALLAGTDAALLGADGALADLAQVVGGAAAVTPFGGELLAEDEAVAADGEFAGDAP
jgi:hypothetical protein